MLLLPTVLAVSVARAQPAPLLSAKEAAEVRAAIEKDREDTTRWLMSDPSSYLAAISRRSFGDKVSLTVGSAPDNDVVIPSLKPRHLRVAVAGDEFDLKAIDDGATFTIGKESTPLRERKTGPAKVGLGRYSLRLSHQGYPALIVFDARSPGFKKYKGIPYFPIDLAYRYVVRLIPDPRAPSFALKSTNGGDRRAQRAGWFEFKAAGKTLRLEVDRLMEPGSGPEDLNVFFRDATTGKESYPVGRYVEPKELPDGSYVLDFNMAYNPACAYSGYYNCPIPPRANTLSVAVRAGEKDPHYH